MERLNYTPWPQSGGPSGKSTGLFRKARAVTISCCIIYYILYWSFIFSQQNTTVYVEDTSHGSDVPKGYALILFAALTLFITVVYVLLVVLVWNLRQHIRTKYHIPGFWCRDLRYALYCNPCAIAQMMRHTTDYDTYISKCCTATGVPKHATSIV
jgi:Cys-rich protein (TIGR01571 family)